LTISGRTAKVLPIVVALFRRYLVLKVSLIVLVAVVLGFSISAVVSARMQIKTMDRLHRNSASFLAKGIAAGVRNAMLTGNGIAVRELLADTKTRITHADVKIFTHEGEEVFGPRAEAPPPSEIDPTVKSALAKAKFHMDPDGRSLYPLKNEKRCVSCHDEGETRGILRIQMEGATVTLDGEPAARHALSSITKEGFIQVMTAKQDDSLDDYFEEMANRTPGLDSIAVYDTDGEVFFGDQELPLKPEEVAKALQPGEPFEFLRDGIHYRLYPLENEPRCQGCHDDGEPMRGALAVGLTPEDFEHCHTVFQAASTSLGHVMMSGLGRLGVGFLNHVAETGVAAGLTLHDPEGRLVHDAFAEPDIPPRVQEAMSTQKEVIHTVFDGGHESMVFIDPMLNEMQCQTCHGTDNEVRGAISITLDTSQAARERAALTQQSIVYASGTVLLVVLLLVFGLRMTVILPVRTIGTAADQIGEGDLNVHIPVGSDDEVGRLAERINDMVSGLRQKLELSKFVSRATIDQVESSDGTVHREGERRQLTVLFSDIRGFTAFSETREPEEVVAMLNAYLQVQSEVVIAHGGDIDKFVGDELMARFSGEGHASRATLAAVEMVEAVAELNQTRGLAADDHIHIGVGINSGEMILGAMGSEQRMDFTVIGDAVNLGARLCSVAARGEVVTSLVSRELANDLTEISFESREPVKVKGKSEPIEIFEVTRSERA
jgi:class 3 adenylate cyclase